MAARIAAAILIAVTAVPAAAQTPLDTTHAEVCWWRPSTPKCSTIIVTEAGIQQTLLSTRATYERQYPSGGTRADTIAFEEGNTVTLNFALLLLSAERTAIGPDFQIGVNSELRRIGLRARRALPDDVVGELRVGVIKGCPVGGDYSNEETTGFSAEVKIGNPRAMGMGLMYDDMPWPNGMPGTRRVGTSGRARSVSATVHFGPAISLTGVVAAFALFFAAMSSISE